MIQDAEVKSKVEKQKPKESVCSTQSKLLKPIDKVEKSVSLQRSMEPVPSSSSTKAEEGFLQDYFISWKKETVSTICDKLSDRQRSAFIFVSFLREFVCFLILVLRCKCK